MKLVTIHLVKLNRGFIFVYFVDCRCVIRGCVPKKILVYGATYGGELEVS